MRLKWTLERLADGDWHKLTCNPVPRRPDFPRVMAEALTLFDDVASDDYMVHTMDRDGCVVVAVRNEADVVSLTLLLPGDWRCYRGKVKLRSNQLAEIRRRAAQ